MHSIAALVLSFFSSSIAQAQTASTPILQARETSGYTLPIHAFERKCTLSEDGLIEGVLNENRVHGSWAISFPFSRKLTDDELSNIKALIQAAKSGEILSGLAHCDAGTTLISARIDQDTDFFSIVNSQDCKPREINQSPATAEIQAWLKTECKIDIIH